MTEVRDRAGLWVPDWVDQPEPVDGVDAGPDVEAPRELRAATPEQIDEEVAKFGKMLEPEILLKRFIDAEQGKVGRASYIDDHPTRFFYRPDVGRLVNRVQAKFPNLTYANTYVGHPPTYPWYQEESVDFWGGGVVNGVYAGYRGKPIWRVVDGNKVFSALFNDPYLPNIAWIIWNGRIWTRDGGWGPSPWGPADSDAGHFNHIHYSAVI